MTQPVPDEYHDTVQTGSSMISQGANLVMWVAEMLGNDSFELDTADGYNIVIKKNDENLISIND